MIPATSSPSNAPIVRDGIEHLDDAECWELLASSKVGRLAIDIAGRPDIFPINHLVADGHIVFRTGAGTKLAGAVLLHHVAFEVDGYDPDERTAWSVVVKGRAHQIEKMQEVYDAEDLPLFPWVTTFKPNFVRITADEVSGRRFHVVDDVVPDSSIGWNATSAVPPAVAPTPGTDFHPGEPRLHPD